MTNLLPSKKTLQRFGLILCAGIIGWLLIFTVNVHQATAVSNGIRWEPAINLSNSYPSSTYPFLLADPYGSIHLFWAEDLGGQAINPDQPVEASNSIMYSQWNGTTWSEPIDLFYTNDGSGFTFPRAALDPSGRLHLVWQAFDGIYYSSAPLQEAGSVKAWEPAQLLANYRGDGPRILADPQGTLHVVYAAWQDAITNNKDGNIYYQSSSDGGKSWSSPYKLTEILPNVDKQGTYPSILMDSQGVLHVVWYQTEPPDYVGSSIHYIRSEDGGNHWEIPVEMSHRVGVEHWASRPEIIERAKGELHLTWVCGEYAYRCHRWSVDGGLNWFPTQREFGNMLALAGNDTLVVDGSGTLYWILQLRLPSAIYYSSWTGNGWSDLQVVNDGALNDGHHVRAVTSLGNQINLAIVDQHQKEIWYMHGITNAAPVQPAPTPTAEIIAAPTETPTPGITASPTPPVFLGKNPRNLEGDLNSQTSFLSISLLSVGSLILFTGISRMWRAKKN